MHPAFWPYLIGLVPILLARSWRARFVAIGFGIVSIGLGVYYVSLLHQGSDVVTETTSVAVPVKTALGIAFASVLCVYFADRPKGVR